VLRNPVKSVAALWLLLSSRTFAIGVKNTLIAPKGIWLAQLARKNKAYHIHAYWGGCSATMAMIASKVSGIPWSMTIHSWELVENNLLSIKAREARFVRVVSQYGKDRLQKHVGPTTDICVMHLGIHLPEPPKLHIRESHTPLRLVVVGNLLPIKGHKYLIDAWAKLRRRGMEVKIDLVGEGPLKQELEEQVCRLEASEHILFHGLISHDLLLSKIAANQWDAMVLPSIISADGNQEGIPISLLEAMSRGLSVISTKTGGIPELIGGGAGLLVAHGDSDALADAIQSLASDPGFQLNLAINGRKRVDEEYAVGKLVHELVQMIQGKSVINESIRDIRVASGIILLSNEEGAE